LYKAFLTASTGRRIHDCISHTRHGNSRKSGNEKVTWGKGGRSGFIENRMRRWKFLTCLFLFLPVSPSSLFSQFFLGLLIDRKRGVTFHLLSLAFPRTVTRILFKSRINRERKLAWMQSIDMTLHRGSVDSNRLFEELDSNLILCGTRHFRESFKMTLAYTGSLAEHAQTYRNLRKYNIRE